MSRLIYSYGEISESVKSYNQPVIGVGRVRTPLQVGNESV